MSWKTQWYRTGLSFTAAAAAAKSLQSCPTLCNSIDGSPSGSPVSGIFQARVLEWAAIALGTLKSCNLTCAFLSDYKI